MTTFSPVAPRGNQRVIHKVHVRCVVHVYLVAAVLIKTRIYLFRIAHIELGLGSCDGIVGG